MPGVRTIRVGPRIVEYLEAEAAKEGISFMLYVHQALRKLALVPPDEVMTQRAIKTTDRQWEKVKEEARRQDVSAGAVVRGLIEMHLGVSVTPKLLDSPDDVPVDLVEMPF